MLTTIFPPKIPALCVSIFVRYIGTLQFWLMFLTSIPFSIKSDSKLKLHPIIKLTKSSRQKSFTLRGSAIIVPFCQTLYFGMSVAMSLPGAHVFKMRSPISVTSKSGHDFGLRWQKRRKSYAYFFGSMQRFPCAYPLHIPLV